MKRVHSVLVVLLGLLMVLTAAVGPVSLYAEENDPRDEAEYIVKYRDNEAALMEEAREPFDLVNGAELQKLLREDALEWYEKDGDAVLMEDDFGGSGADLMDFASEYYDTEKQWNLSLINAEAAFRSRALGDKIRVGVVDSGVSPHTDFGGRLLPGHNFMADAKGDTVKEADTTDEYGHGTRVAGLIAAAGASGYIGTAPAAELVPLKCTDGNTVKISAICSAIYSAIEDYGCEVLNLSLGVQTEYESLREAIAYAEQNNVIVVSAVGNGGRSTVYYPAAYDSVIGVGSVDRNGDLYSRSNHNESVFLTAPGVEVRSTDRLGGYKESTGCSFAIPQVSGAAAVMLGIDKSLTPEQIRKIFSDTAVDRGAEGYDEYYGYGILNLGGCVAALTGAEEDETADPFPSQPSESPEDIAHPEPSDELELIEGSDPEDGDPPAEPKNPSVSPEPADSPEQPGGQDGSDSSETPVPSGQGSSPGSQGSSGQTDQGKTTEPDHPPVPVDSPDIPEVPAASWKDCPRDAGCILNDFADLDRNAWYHNGIHCVLETGIMNGYEDQTFRPDQDTSRAMIVTMLWRVEGSPASDGDTTFRDVPEGQWYTEAVRWAASRELMTGYSSTAFGPDDKVNREQLATILWRYAVYKCIGGKMPDYPDLLGSYTDTEQISSWALEAARWATGSGLMQGMTETTLSPKTNAVRAQVATMLMRFTNLN